MTLDSAYLTYPKRRRGMDHDLYAWSNMFERRPIQWPGGRAVAVCIVISLEYFPITPKDLGFRAPGHMQTPYPDFRHYTAREYGTRVGFYRILDSLARHGICASIAMNSEIAARYPSIAHDVVAAGHEIIAHATDMNAVIVSGISETEELAIIRESLQRIEQVTRVRPRGWHSIARSQSWNTPRLLAQSGLRYQCDWVNDELPYLMSTAAGPLVNLPLNHELSDRQVIQVQQQSIDEFAEQLRDAHAWLQQESASFGGRMLPVHLTPYISGLPYRIDALDALLGWLAAQASTWFATGSQLVENIK